MGRFSPSPSYNHGVSDIGHGCYRIHWTVDRYYAGSRLRHPQIKSRDTDRDGALRFIKKWNINWRIPASLTENANV